MIVKEARDISGQYVEEVITPDMDSIYSTIDYCIKEAAKKGIHGCVANIDGCDKPWSQIYKERELIEGHYKELGYEVDCLGYSRPCIWDSYGITW